MHIPDGFLSTPVWATLDAAALPVVAWMARRAKSQVEETRIPLLGVMGAFVFAAQMINFPVGPGVSGHLVGAALLAYVLGAAPAVIVMTAILAIQALVFQDGGIVVMGANILNMAVAGVFAALIPYRALRGSPVGIFAGAFLSVMLSASLALAQLLLSGVKMPLGLLWVSIGLFAVSAVLEGAITVAVIGSIERIRAGWIQRTAESGSKAVWALATAAVVLVIAGVLFASTAPDGIAHLARETGIAGHAYSLYQTALGDYEWKGLDSLWLRKSAAGLAGLTAVFGVCFVAGRVLRRK